MAVILQFKRRAAGGAAGAPAALRTAEPAYNEQDETLYLGRGDNGSGEATSVVPIAGRGAFVDKTTAQSIDGVKTFTASPVVPTPMTNMQAATKKYVDDSIAGFGAGDMAKTTYDSDNDGKVDAAETADAVPWGGVTGKPATFAPSAHAHAISDVTGLDAALNAKAPLASPALTGNPTAPTAAGGTSSTQVATTAFVAAAVQSIVGMAPADLDTLVEIATRIQQGETDHSGLVTQIAGKLAKSANLSDLTDVAAARTNLQLASMALQAANNVNITGGTISGVALDGGTF